MSNRKTGNKHEDKIAELMSQMTLEEKIGQLTQYGTSIYTEELDLRKNDIRKGKIGSFLSIQDADLINQLQHIAVEESRLGIPLLFGYDVIHGFRTIYPIPLAQACSWDTDLVEQCSEAAAAEAYCNGQRWTFAPMVDICRDPRWGRIAEGFGEDPFLSSEMSKASVHGYQGDNPELPGRIAACAKHFAGYGGAVGGRDYNTVDMSLQTLHETYLPPFKAAVEADVQTLMCAFNDLNGTPCSANQYLINDILKDKWRFDGFVVSDANSILELEAHRYAENDEDAAAKAVNAGVDMDMASGIYANNLYHLVETGAIDETVINNAVRRILNVKLNLGLFDHPYADPDFVKSKSYSVEYTEEARKSAQRSIVLLKNKNNLLPLQKKSSKIAVIGPLADDVTNPLGCWVTYGKSQKAVSVLEGIKNTVEPECTVLYAKGCNINDDSQELFSAALETATQADIILAVLGESNSMSGEMHCRSNLDLPGVQEELFLKLHQLGKPVIVILMNGRPLSIRSIANHADAILETWHLGSQSGNAIADVLFGDYNPSGKLAATFPQSVGQVPIYYNHPNTGRPADEKIEWSSKYLDLPIEPLYPFGYGLSYTDFKYNNLCLDKNEVQTGESIKISVDVTNTGSIAGEEVVQLYITDLCASRVRPVKELKGFRKALFNPNETKTVCFEIATDALGFYNDKMEYITEPGWFEVQIGTNSMEGITSRFKLV